MQQDLKGYINKHLEDIKRDCKTLININSVKTEAKDGAPYGEGIRKVQLAAIEICERLGFSVVDCEGVLSFAHYGPEDKFIGMASHLDVVPAVDGWDSDPFDCTERDGYLVGRGAYDNKIPFVLTVYAAKYFMDNKIPLKYGIRIFMGTDEESGMTDLEYYLKNYKAPVFSFTPDHRFPVCHGEKGRFETNLISQKIASRAVVSIDGGNASNAVSDRCKAVIKREFSEKLIKTLTGNSNISYSLEQDVIVITTVGQSQHASKPKGATNANQVMTKLLLESGILSGEEKNIVEFINSSLESLDGEFYDIVSDDGIFTPLTIIGGKLNIVNDSYVLNLDSRYPTSIEPKTIEQKIFDKAVQNKFTIGKSENSPPYYISTQNPAIEALLESYKEVTGYEDKPYVMAGATYARVLPNAVSFGIKFDNRKKQPWAGEAHMKNEAVPVSDMIDATEIFIKSITKLQQLDF